MVSVGLLARFPVRPGKEEEFAALLREAVALVDDEPATTAWFGLRIGPSEFGIFDAFPDEDGRKAHLAGRLAEILMGKGAELFAGPPSMEEVDVIASKLPA
ncbi:putative quinol monooxygenase [Streptomyces sp. HPF1205]|uniref:putative quinol monooxygenase n=1 Tax=Streptomyces sp. HPF1205 TaxID=2873262 RepID=UPI001CEC7BD1|nr:antibiotic biosynthesis monooxygenase [Streptomyces sp. HPF1205]